jgi:hypothetical protein
MTTLVFSFQRAHLWLETHVRGPESKIEALETALLRARAGHRQVVFITGEAGLGKTSLVDCCLTDFGSKEPAILAVIVILPPL